MRYAWGHGVGHTYSHSDAPDSSTAAAPSSSNSGDTATLSQLPDAPLEPGEEELASAQPFTSADDTLEDLEGEELALADPGDESEASDYGEAQIQEPDSETED